MDYVKQYRNFINSHYFTEGLRMTAGILIPAFLMSYFNLFQFGVLMSLGALCVSITDNPGPVHHRRNGMVACIGAIFVMSLLTNVVHDYTVITAILIALSAMLFSMLGVFGARPGGIGISALVVLILQVDNTVQPNLPTLQHAVLLAGGGIWYLCFSLLLYSFRPYKLAQQSMGEWFQHIATYLHTRARLYDEKVDYAKVYQTLLQEQSSIQEKQAVLREILLKTRAIVKESTPQGRLLLITFIHMNDVFEKLITSYSRYRDLHQHFDETGLLKDLQEVIEGIAHQLEHIGFAIKSGKAVKEMTLVIEKFSETFKRFEQLRQQQLEAANLDVFISLQRTFQNIEDIIEDVQTIGQNICKGKPDSETGKKYGRRDTNAFLSQQPIAWRELWDNLTFKSDIFRHSVRVTIALVTGFIVGIAFNIGHAYWILLTILVILKPAYSLSKKRNRDRLFGTVAGVLIGLGILAIIQNQAALLVIMVILMAANFSFMRTNYFLSVLLMTPYILIFFSILHPQNFTGLLKDRVLDTAIGSIIAFAASFLLFPSWEKNKIHPLLVKAVEKVKNYFTKTTVGLGSGLMALDRRLARKDAFIALANVSDAFNRMLNEPKHQQTSTETLQRFVVLLQFLVSYIATLGFYIDEDMHLPPAHPLKKASTEIEKLLNQIIHSLNGKVDENSALNPVGLELLHGHTRELLQQRLKEMDEGLEDTPTKGELFEVQSIAQQFKLISKSASDIKNISHSLSAIQ